LDHYLHNAVLLDDDDLKKEDWKNLMKLMEMEDQNLMRQVIYN
jgi:hypothetical protein